MCRRKIKIKRPACKIKEANIMVLEEHIRCVSPHYNV